MPTFERGAKSATSQIGVQWFKEETPNTRHQREIKYKNQKHSQRGKRGSHRGKNQKLSESPD